MGAKRLTFTVDDRNNSDAYPSDAREFYGNTRYQLSTQRNNVALFVVLPLSSQERSIRNPHFDRYCHSRLAKGFKPISEEQTVTPFLWPWTLPCLLSINYPFSPGITADVVAQ